MPTTVIHEIVSRKLTKKYKNLDNYNFYLGSTAPDSVNVDGFAEKELRWTAHIRDKDLNKWKNNIINFYNNEKSNYNESFIKGYITHIMTDIIYDELFYDEVTGKIDIDDYNTRHRKMLDYMNSYGINNKDYNYVIDILNSNNETYDIRNINKELMKRWKLKVINDLLISTNDNIINDELLERITKEVEKELKNNNIL